MTSSPIRDLNDAFRTGGPSSEGRWMLTAGVLAEGPEFAALAVATVRSFTGFAPGNDPYGEHDFGAFNLAGHHLFWKIDYYAPDLCHGSEDPADPAVTSRVLTLMLASEY
ncbi:MAG: DUF3768 domain-containing protein [Proteobacteria bacterium]|nr:DUF3768 domain-containing protein [Pseudomonadota bacterium]